MQLLRLESDWAQSKARKTIQGNSKPTPIPHLRSVFNMCTFPIPTLKPILSSHYPKTIRTYNLYIEPNPVRSAFRGRGPDGVLRFHATIAQLQATVARLCGGTPEKLDHPYISVAAAGLFRYVILSHSLSLSLSETE